MFCKKCGNKIFEKSKFCDKCGDSIDVNKELNKSSTSYKCEQCGQENNINSIFCRNCGINLPYKSCKYCGHKLSNDSIFCEKCGEKTKDKEINHNGNHIKIYNISIAQLIILIIFSIVSSFFCFVIYEDSYAKNSELYGFLGIFILFLILFYIFGWAKNKKRK